MWRDDRVPPRSPRRRRARPLAPAGRHRAEPYAAVVGYLVAEVFGSLPRLIGDTEQLYRAHLRAVMFGMGFDPTLINAADAQHHGQR